VCGPGSIEQAHKPDEFIERAELDVCEVFLDRAVAQQCVR
jgi:acetylornithine deacetylase